MKFNHIHVHDDSEPMLTVEWKTCQLTAEGFTEYSVNKTAEETISEIVDDEFDNESVRISTDNASLIYSTVDEDERIIYTYDCKIVRVATTRY